MAGDEHVFEVVGLGRGSRRIYEALLTTRTATLDELAASAQLPASEVRDELRRLESLGLVSRLIGSPTRFVTVEPDIGLGGLLLEREAELRRARRKAQMLAELFRDAVADRSSADLVEVITGPEEIRRREQELFRNARHEVRGLDRPPYHASSLTPNEAELDFLKRGGVVRGIYEKSAVELQGRMPKLEQEWAAGEVARVLPSVPCKLLLIDDDLAFTPLRSGLASSPSFVVAHRSALLDTLSALFETLWRLAIPLESISAATTASPAESADEARVLMLMVAGLPDRAIADCLGISLRTLERRIQALMERLGATTRFQLGVELVRRGWVGRGVADAYDATVRDKTESAGGAQSL